MSRKRNAICSLTFLLVVVVPECLADQTDQPPTPKELIAELHRQQNRIKFAEAKFKYLYKNNGFLIEGTWWFSGDGRQKYDSVNTSTDKKSGKVFKVRSVVAFDGQKQRILRKDEGAPFATGRIDGLEPENFSNAGTPYDLLGYGFDFHRGMSLAETLRDSEQIHVQPNTVKLDGRTCYLVEATHASVYEETGEIYDMRVWLDVERDLRPLRIEKYFGLPGANRWQVLRSRLRGYEM